MGINKYSRKQCLKNRKVKIQGAERIPNRMNPKKFTTGYIIINLLKAKSKEKISKADRNDASLLGKY